MSPRSETRWLQGHQLRNFTSTLTPLEVWESKCNSPGSIQRLTDGVVKPFMNTHQWCTLNPDFSGKCLKKWEWIHDLISISSWRTDHRTNLLFMSQTTGFVTRSPKGSASIIRPTQFSQIFDSLINLRQIFQPCLTLSNYRRVRSQTGAFYRSRYRRAIKLLFFYILFKAIQLLQKTFSKRKSF